MEIQFDFVFLVLFRFRRSTEVTLMFLSFSSAHLRYSFTSFTPRGTRWKIILCCLRCCLLFIYLAQERTAENLDVIADAAEHFHAFWIIHWLSASCSCPMLTSLDFGLCNFFDRIHSSKHDSIFANAIEANRRDRSRRRENKKSHFLVHSSMGKNPIPTLLRLLCHSKNGEHKCKRSRKKVNTKPKKYVYICVGVCGGHTAKRRRKKKSVHRTDAKHFGKRHKRSAGEGVVVGRCLSVDNGIFIRFEFATCSAKCLALEVETHTIRTIYIVSHILSNYKEKRKREISSMTLQCCPQDARRFRFQ